MAVKNLLVVEDYVVPNILKEFNRSENELKDDVASLAKWMESQPHLPEVADPRFIRNFLFLNKFSIEQTKQKLDMYYTVKSKLKELYDQINPEFPHMQECRDILYILPYPKLTKNMERVFVLKVRKRDLVSNLEYINVVRQYLNITEIRMREDVAFGEVYIFDFDGLTSFLLRFSPTVIYQGLVQIYQAVYSLRIKAVYLINFPPVAQKLLLLIKTMMKPKIFERIHISSYEEIKEKFASDMLPKEFGGEGPSFQELQDMLEKTFKENVDLFNHLDKMRVNEELRPEKLKNDEVLGVYGNFKKLNID